MFIAVVIGGWCAAGTASAQSSDCQTANFAPEVTQRFPRVREVCRQIVMRDNTEYAEIKAQVARVRSDGVDVRFQMPDGRKSDRRYIKTRPEFRVLIEGRPTRVRDLNVGTELTAYVKVHEPVVQLAQPATDPPESAPLESMEPETDTRLAENMPATGSMVPSIALVGLLLVGGAALIRRTQREG
jgi:LPXTG-motif cell wall-anchored protein